MIQVCAIGGEPATGKSTLAIRLLEELSKKEHPRQFRLSFVRGLEFRSEKLFVLGVYEGTTFPGTDRLSMAVQPETINWLTFMNQAETWHGWQVLFEGDRLCTGSFFSALSQQVISFRLFLTVCNQQELANRRATRKQSAIWLKGRAAKWDGLQRAWPCQMLPNGNEKELFDAISFILNELERFRNNLPPFSRPQPGSS
jgi:Predicted ATP-dependent serine protease